nr:MAG TPA: hypothetical protein [Bacteriophage sp.]
MSILGFFNKHGKIEQYEKKNEPMGDIIPFPEKEKKGLEELKFIDITRPVKKSARSANR